MAGNEKLEVEILERRELPLPTVDGKERKEIWITYRFGTLPPGLLRLSAEGLTEEKELAAIRADIQRRTAQQPKKVKV